MQKTSQDKKMHEFAQAKEKPQDGQNHLSILLIIKYQNIQQRERERQSTMIQSQ